MSDGNYSFYLFVLVLVVGLGLWKGGELVWHFVRWVLA